MNGLSNKLKHLIYALDIKLNAKQNIDGVNYIFVNNRSRKLIIIFDGIGGDYNYRRSLKNSTYDQLYIKDNWAGGTSYYLYEKGSNHPEIAVSRFIETFTKEHTYDKIVTMGSSKGGSCAIYYGLKHKVSAVYAGASQFLVGNYIGIFHENKGSGYYKNVMGGIELSKGIAILNNAFALMLEQNANSPTIVHLIYSTEEHTYTDDIVPLIRKLDECQITHIDQVEKFQEHSMIGNVMKNVCKKELM